MRALGSLRFPVVSTLPGSATDGDVVYLSTEGQPYIRSAGAWRPFPGFAYNAQVASYTLAIGDANDMVSVSNASANTLTVPPNSSVAFAIGTQVGVIQLGAGQTTLTPGSGVTIQGTPGLKLRAQYSGASLLKIATDTWVAVGDLAA